MSRMGNMGRPFGLTGDLKDLPGSPFLGGLAAAARGVGAPTSGGPNGLDGFPGGLPGALALSHHMGQPGFGLHHFIDPRLPFSAAAAAGAFRPIFGTAAAAAAAIAASQASATSTTASSHLSDSIIGGGLGSGNKVTSSAFQPPNPNNQKGGPTSPPGISSTGPGGTLFSPGQNLYPHRGCAGSPGTPSSSPPSSSVAPPSLHSRNASSQSGCGGGGGNGGGGNNPSTGGQNHSGIKLPDENSNMAALVDRHESLSPASMDGSIYESGHMDERSAKKIRLSSSSSANNEVGCCCPICGMPLRTSELEMHYTQELEYLTKLSASLIVSANNQQRLNQVRSPNQPHHGLISPSMKNQLSLEVAPRSRWDTFQRIQRNRQSRIRVKLSRRAGKRSDEILEEDIVPEPVSNSHQGQHNDLHHHQFQQSRTKMEQPQSSSTPAPTSSTNPDEEDIDIVGDDGNNNKNNHNNTSSNLSSSESSRDLQLHVYGPPQFTEADVLACMNEEQEESDEDKKSEMETESCTDSREMVVKREVASPTSLSGSAAEDEEHSTPHNKAHGVIGPASLKMNSSDVHKTNNLKIKIKLEDKSKCSKCLKSLKEPVVNVGCWHVQCEKCWLGSLGTKKCCSLCGTLTVPSDLRRVFL